MVYPSAISTPIYRISYDEQENKIISDRGAFDTNNTLCKRVCCYDKGIIGLIKKSIFSELRFSGHSALVNQFLTIHF